MLQLTPQQTITVLMCITLLLSSLFEARPTSHQDQAKLNNVKRTKKTADEIIATVSGIFSRIDPAMKQLTQEDMEDYALLIQQMGAFSTDVTDFNNTDFNNTGFTGTDFNTSDVRYFLKQIGDSAHERPSVLSELADAVKDSTQDVTVNCTAFWIKIVSVLNEPASLKIETDIFSQPPFTTICSDLSMVKIHRHFLRSNRSTVKYQNHTKCHARDRIHPKLSVIHNSPQVVLDNHKRLGRKQFPSRIVVETNPKIISKVQELVLTKKG